MTPPLLSADMADWSFDLSLIPYPVLATPKIDGIRCTIRTAEGHKMALSRTLKPIPNHHIYSQLINQCPDGLDGELIIPSLGFNDIQSAVMSYSSPLQQDFRFVVFDVFDLNKPYSERVVSLALTALPPFCDKLIPMAITNEHQLVEYETSCLEAGYEGVMLRTPSSPYRSSSGKENRSTLKRFHLVKLKRRLTDEATVIGFEPRYHNANSPTTDERGLTKRSKAQAGLVPLPELGAFIVRHPTFGDFGVSGFTEVQRSKFWESREALLGSVLTFAYLPHGMKDKPRHPVFKGFRHADDL